MPDLTDYRNHGTVAKGGKVTVVQAGTDPWVVKNPQGSVKNALMRIMYESATDPNRPRVNPTSQTAGTGPIINDKHHFVGMSILELSKRATALMNKHVGQHEVVHALFDLRTQQFVKFHTSKSQGNANRRQTDEGAGMGGSTPYGGIPVRLQLTAKGLEEGARLMRPFFTPETMTTPEQPNGNAHTSDLEVEGGTPVVDEAERVVALVPDRPQPEAEPAIQIQAEPSDKFQYVTGYPEILKASQAERRVNDAARLLRLAGHDTLADMALAELTHRTALEAEITRFIADLREQGIVLVNQDLLEGGAEEG